MAKSKEILINQKQEKRKTETQAPIEHIEYYDHVLFKNCNPKQIKPAKRKTVGWITHENHQAIIISSDISVQKLNNEKIQDSGLLILKNLIIKRVKIELGNAFKQNNIANYGKNP